MPFEVHIHWLLNVGSRMHSRSVHGGRGVGSLIPHPSRVVTMIIYVEYNFISTFISSSVGRTTQSLFFVRPRHVVKSLILRSKSARMSSNQVCVFIGTRFIRTTIIVIAVNNTHTDPVTIVNYNVKKKKNNC